MQNAAWRVDASLSLASADAMVESGKEKAAQSGRLTLTPMKISIGLRFTRQGRRVNRIVKKWLRRT